MTLTREFWSPEAIPPIPLLRDLNDWVIKRNERRLPKWKFRFASDLAAQIQPKITRAHALLFHCTALMTEDVTVKFFTQRALLRDRLYWMLGFELFTDEPGAVWTFNPTSVARLRWESSSDGWLDLRQRIIGVLHPDRFAHLTPDLMLSAHCLCCGRGLTDPASMARWIGPECWGSASTNLPRLFKADQTEPTTNEPKPAASEAA
jgi:hypothetical protein